MKKYLSVLRMAPVFSGMSDDDIEGVLSCLGGKTAEYDKDDYILHAGDTVETVGLLLSGSVLVVKEDFWGNRNIISRIMPGQIFAESFACAPGAALSVSAVADEKCAVMWLGVRRILSTCPTACPRHSRVIENLLTELARKNLLINEKLGHMSQRTTRKKLLSYLSEEARRHGSAEFTIQFDRQQLADYLSVERSAMSAELSHLRSEGLLEYDRNRFRLSDAARSGTAR